jgi:hypothetical protein
MENQQLKYGDYVKDKDGEEVKVLSTMANLVLIMKDNKKEYRLLEELEKING